MQAAEVIQRYEHILAASGEMIAAAEENRWEDLVNLEITRRDLIVVVTAEPATPYADAALQARKESLIRGILAADERVKALTAAWMTEMEGILTSVQAERKLARAYETG
ncbi:MAG: flagellar protein FliT [Burkholderiales bacterium]|nr:flagellar protein FliT [Burkholderiales bacterium]